MSGERILVVDDEPHIVDLARLYLEREGFRVEAAGDGAAALQRIREREPSLVVLDLMLPEVDGYEVCRRVRAESNVPILMLTARDTDVDRIVGLELGADDYLTKPFHPREFVARVRAILRRAQAAPNSSGRPFRLGDLTVDPGRREVHVRDQEVPLRAQEFELLLVLAKHPGLVLTREQLLSQAWGYDFAGETRTVDVHVGHLRRKLASSATVRIETVTGVGYKLVA